MLFLTHQLISVTSNISSRFFGNSESFALELLQNLEKLYF